MQKRRGPVLLLISAIVASTLSFSTSALAVVSSKYLNAPNITQLNSQWCWAGTAISMLKYFALTTPTQCHFVAWVKTADENGTCDNVPASLLDEANGLVHWGLGSTLTGTYLTYNGVMTEITNGRPFVARWEYLSGSLTGQGHVVVVDGYYHDTNLGTEQLEYMDPGPGQHYAMEYADFVYTASQWSWNATLYNVYK